MHLVKEVAELVAVLQLGDLNSTDVLFVLALLNAHELHILLQAHQLALYALKDLVEEH